MRMRGASKIKSIILVLIMGMVVVLGIFGMDTVRTYMSGASADFQPSEVGSNVAADGKSAQVTWKTIKDSRGYVEYGTTPASLLLRSEVDSTSGSTDHSITLSPLKVNMNYYYRIRVGEDEEKKSEWEVFDNGGIPYSFNTKIGGAGPITSPTPTIFVAPSVSPTVFEDLPGVTRAMPTGLPTVVTNKPAVNCLTGVDYNHDGIVNSLDYITCLKGQVTGMPSAPAPRPSVSAVPTQKAGPTVGAGSCKAGVDYDANGIVNSLDMVKCLQGR